MTKFHLLINSWVVFIIFLDFIRDSPTKNASAPLFEKSLSCIFLSIPLSQIFLLYFLELILIDY